MVKKKKKEEKLKASLPIYDMKGKEVETLDLDKDIFDGRVNKAVLYQAVIAYNANQRGGRASTKTISEVSGGGRKPWPQKGTGRARHASIRSPLWPGGGIMHGPHPRDFHYHMPKKISRLALASSLNAKWQDNNLKGLDSLVVAEPKTRLFKALIKALKLTGKTTFVLDAIDKNTRLAARNLEEAVLKNVKDINLMDILNSKNVVITKAAFAGLTERFKRG